MAAGVTVRIVALTQIVRGKPSQPHNTPVPVLRAATDILRVVAQEYDIKPLTQRHYASFSSCNHLFKHRSTHRLSNTFTQTKGLLLCSTLVLYKQHVPECRPPCSQSVAQCRPPPRAPSSLSCPWQLSDSPTLRWPAMPPACAQHHLHQRPRDRKSVV